MKIIEVVGPGGRRMIEEKDLQEYENKGYAPLSAVQSEVPEEEEELDGPDN